MDQELRQLFLNEKPASAVVTLSRKNPLYIRQISRKIDATYSHTLRLLERMEQNGLVESEQSGRKREYRLTSQGESVAGNFADFFDGADENSVDKDVSPVISSANQSHTG